MSGQCTCRRGLRRGRYGAKGAWTGGCLCARTPSARTHRTRNPADRAKGLRGVKRQDWSFFPGPAAGCRPAVDGRTQALPAAARLGLARSHLMASLRIEPCPNPWTRQWLSSSIRRRSNTIQASRYLMCFLSSGILSPRRSSGAVSLILRNAYGSILQF